MICCSIFIQKVCSSACLRDFMQFCLDTFCLHKNVCIKTCISTRAIQFSNIKFQNSTVFWRWLVTISLPPGCPILTKTCVSKNPVCPIENYLLNSSIGTSGSFHILHVNLYINKRRRGVCKTWILSENYILMKIWAIIGLVSNRSTIQYKLWLHCWQT